ncbi:MAG TPA: hypothetical protein VGB55_02565 [Tepidisphaeraceae bacterium]|jgi:hypothetical protein
MTNDDPIVEEARRAGEDYIKTFDGNLSAVVTDLQRRTESHRQAGREVIALPPRKPREMAAS